MAERCILPILDGIDEQQDPARALRALGILAADDQPFVATCRTSEYRDAVARSRSPFGATVVELELPDIDDVVNFLVWAVPTSDERWAPVIHALRQDPAGPLAAVLSRPTYLQLLRSIYARADSAPSELLDTARFPTGEAIERRLLAGFLDTAFSAEREYGGRATPPGNAVPWLSSLATRLDRAEGVDITLPALARTAPVLANLAAAALFALVAGVGGGWAGGAWLAGVLAAGVLVAGGLAAVGRFAFRAIGPGWRHGVPIRTLAVGIVGSTAATGVGLFLADAAERPAVLAVGFGFLAMPVLTTLAGEPVGARLGISQWATTHADARYTALSALLCGAVAAATAVNSGNWPTVAAAALAGAMVGVLGTATFRLFVSRLWMAARGEAPFRLLQFLDQAHRVGVLRQHGGAYQFRNRALQLYLTAQREPPDIVVRPPEHTAAGNAITRLRVKLVEGAFQQASVRELVDPDRVDRLREEIGAELRNVCEPVAAATSAHWDLLTAARARYRTEMSIPRLAHVSAAYGWAAGALAAFAAAGLVLRMWDTRGAAPIVVAGSIVAGGALLLELPELERNRLALLARAEAREKEQDQEQAPTEAELRARNRRRRLARLLRIPIFPAAWWRWSRPAARILVVLGAVAPVAYFTGKPIIPSTALQITAAAAVVLLGLWWWSRPWYGRLLALRSDDADAWPKADETPWAAPSRRLAVRAWEEWAASVVDLGVLPLVSAKVEPLTRRSYETALPPVSLERLGDITEGVQFVNTEESERLNRMLVTTPTAAIGISGPRGVGKTTLLRRFGDQRIGSSADNLMLVVPAPTSYNGRDFLVHLFARLCLALLPPGDATTEPGHARRRIRTGWPWVSAIAGAVVVAGAIWWETATGIPAWLRDHARAGAIAAGALLVLVPLVRAAVVFLRRRRRPQDSSVVDLARQHLRRLRYLETLTVTRGATLKAPPTLDLTGSMARQRAEHVRTYPQLVGDFREFLGLVALHLRSRPGRSYSRVVICIDELDKISSAEQAEQFLNDVKAIFGVDGCLFLVAVSEDALSSFARRALSARTTFDTAFDDILTLRRFGLADTRRLLVQRVLRLPEPYVWLCHCLSGGLPRDLNRTVRLLYDVQAHRKVTEFPQLAAELVRQDLESLAYGQALKLTDQSDPATACLARWLIGARHLTLTAETVREYAKTAPATDNDTKPEIVLSTEQFVAYLEYLAALLDRFCERTAETIERLRDLDDDAASPALCLAEARAALSADPVTARAAVDDFLHRMAGP